MNEALDFILGGLELVFGIRWVAPFLFAFPMLLWAGFLSLQETQRTRPYLKAVETRIATLRTALGDDADPSAERAAFSTAFPEVASSLAAGKRTDPLVLAWAEFHESIVDETATPIENTSRPSTFFQRAAPKQARLVFWSNLMVGLGLLLTFLGLIVALHTARKGMAPGADPAAMQESLRTLLAVAGAKFFTSVAGVGSSLILRSVERNLSRKTSHLTDELCNLLERGLLYVPPQRLAVKQLRELEAQTAQLKIFNTDFALQVSERMATQFQQVMAPVSASLLTLNDNIAGMGDSLRDGLGKGAADAISQATGGELRALGQTLGTLGERLDALSSSVGSSGEHAAEQIRAAGADFSQAASDIRAAFENLAGQVDGLGGKLAEQGEASARAQNEALERMLKGLTEAQDSSAEALGKAVGSLERAGAEAASGLETRLTKMLDGFTAAQANSAETLGKGVEALERAGSEAASGLETRLARMLDGLTTAQAGSAETLGRGVEALERAGAEAAARLQAGLSKAMEESVAASQQTFQHALDESGGALRDTALGLAKAVGDAAEQIERAKDGFVKSGEGAARTALAMAEVAGQSRTAAGAIGDATKGLTAVAGPVSQAVQAVNDAAGRISRSIEANQRTEAETLQSLKSLVEGVRDTQQAASSAWQEYRARFEGVDKNLENVTVRLGETLGNTFAEFRKFTQQVDSELGGAVSKLSAALTQIEDYAGALDEYVNRVQKSEGAK